MSTNPDNIDNMSNLDNGIIYAPLWAEVELRIYECGCSEIAVMGGTPHHLCPRCDASIADGRMDEAQRYEAWQARQAAIAEARWQEARQWMREVEKIKHQFDGEPERQG